MSLVYFPKRSIIMKRILVCIVSVLVCSLLLWAELRTFSAVPVFQDPDNPAVLHGVWFPDENDVVKLAITNRTTETIDRVRVGWTISDCGPDGSYCQWKPEVIAIGVEDSVPLQIVAGGDGITTVKLPRNAFNRAVKRKQLDDSNQFTFYFGLVGVEFANGLSWEYDLINEGNWEWPAVVYQSELKLLEESGLGGKKRDYAGGESWSKCVGQGTKQPGPHCEWAFVICCCQVEGPQGCRTEISCASCP